MANFSGAVKLADLNDFIAPSQACVVSLKPLQEKLPLDEVLQDDTVDIQKRSHKSKTGQWSQTLPTTSPTDAIKISLQDCLACSGCVTSAETVLLEHQSVEELMARVEDPGVNVVVTLSQQSIASLAVAHGVSQVTAARKLSAFLRRLGVRAVLDATVGRDLALMETANEFIERYQHAYPELGTGVSAACSDQHARTALQSLSCGASSSGREHPSASRQSLKEAGLPMLASACPGWVCYAEKTHGDYVLPYISTTKSPQAIMGSLVKRLWTKQRGIEASSVYHCAIMPCYDKKLEAAREDFFLPGTQVPETDAVLTTLEVQQLMDQWGESLGQLPEEPLDSLMGQAQHHVTAFPGGSGGYMEYVYRTAAQRLLGTAVAPGPLPMRTLRNADFQEVSLDVPGRPPLRFALAYGFRNIQTLLRKVKHGLSPYDYVEVMACPSGCLNGGGQLRPVAGQTAQQLIEQVEAAYHHPQVIQRLPEENLEATRLYQYCLENGLSSDAAHELLHTQYHKREKTITASIGDW